MNKENIKNIFYNFVKDKKVIEIQENRIGHINNTFFIYTKNRKYVLQKISHIFNRKNVCFNIKEIFYFLKNKKDSWKIWESFKILTPVFLADWKICLNYKNEFYRLYEFIENSIVLDEITLENTEDIWRWIWEFYSYLDWFNWNLKEPFDNFHNIRFYYNQYLKLDKNYKYNKNQEEIKIKNWIDSNVNKLEKYADLIEKLPKRLIHQDMKLSNMLFDENWEKLVSIVDWDTFDLWSILIDFWDMCRSFITKVDYNLEIFELFLKGYFSKMKDILTNEEKQNLLLAFEMINLELAIRYFNQYLWWEKVFNLENKEILQKILKLYNTANFLKNNKQNLEQIVLKYI